MAIGRSGKCDRPAGQRRVAWIAGGVALALAGLAVAVPWPRPTARPPARSALPTLVLSTRPADLARLLTEGATTDAEGKTWLEAELREDDAGAIRGKVTGRGFSDWHRHEAKPSLRFRTRDAGPDGAPRYQELSRPEDVLALCNVLPDRLAEELGLLTARADHVRLFLNDRWCGVYLRSLRPGDDLARAADRLPGTFFKGDSLGERRRLDLWSGAAAWRTFGREEPAAVAALDALLQTLRQPPSPARIAALEQLLDLDHWARAAAIAALTGNIHADRAHNHVLFWRPEDGLLERVPWDQNAFGIHAQPDVPVDVARHPLREALASDPRWLLRRSQILWQLLHGPGSARALEAAADRMLTVIGPDLAADPALGVLQFHRGDWQLKPSTAGDLPRWRERFGAWVRAREQFLRGWLTDARVHVASHPERADWSVVTVFGNVGVRASTRDGRPPRAADGRIADVLLPGRTAALADEPQHRVDGIGIPAPHPLPAPLRYEVAAPAAELSFRNVITGAPVAPAAWAPEPVPLRSVHPWSFPPPADGALELGPGAVTVTQRIEAGRGQTLRIAPGTELILGPGAAILVRGRLLAEGTADAPIRIRGGAGSGGIAAVGSPEVRLRHVLLTGLQHWQQGHRAFRGALELQSCGHAELEDCRIEQAGAAVAMRVSRSPVRMVRCTIASAAEVGAMFLASEASLQDCAIATAGGSGMVAWGGSLDLSGGGASHCRRAGLQLAEGARARVRGAEFGWNHTGIEHQDGCRLLLEDTRLQANLRGFASVTPPEAWGTGTAWLWRCTFRDQGGLDLELAGAAGVHLVQGAGRAGGPELHRLAVQDEPPPDLLRLAAPGR